MTKTTWHVWKWSTCPRLQGQENRKAVVDGTLTLSHCSGSRAGRVLNLFPSVFRISLGLQRNFTCVLIFILIFSITSLYLIMSPPYLTLNSPTHTHIIFFISPSLSLFDPFSFTLSLWCFRLVLVVTVFISSILEGLRRDEIHSFVGGVKKTKEGPVQYSTLFMVPWDP